MLLSPDMIHLAIKLATDAFREANLFIDLSWTASAPAASPAAVSSTDDDPGDKPDFFLSGHRSASPGTMVDGGSGGGSGVGGGNIVSGSAIHSPSLNSSYTNRSGSLPRPISPSPSLTSDKLEQDFQVLRPGIRWEAFFFFHKKR